LVLDIWFTPKTALKSYLRIAIQTYFLKITKPTFISDSG